MSNAVSPVSPFAPGASFSLAGPSQPVDSTRLPVRGDMAHVRLAGVVFVPHYVAPLAYRARAEASVLTRPGGEVLATLPAGARFDVLDMAAGHAWGEVPGGAVGYVALGELEQA